MSKNPFFSKLRSCLSSLLIGMCVVVQAAAPLPVQAKPAQPQSESAAISGCEMFPSNNMWNTPVDNLPVDARSDDWVDTIGRTTGFHMDFGSGIWDGGPIGIPYNVVGSGTTKVPVTFDYDDESDPGPYPIPSTPLIEYGSDRHILIVDNSTCTLYELYNARYTGGAWQAGSGAIWNLNSNVLRPDEWTSADAAGLPILPGLVRYDEIASGVIDHAIRFTASSTNDYIWPARHLTSDDPGATDIPPMGARFRLKADFDISAYPSEMQVILQAMKTYGIILADNGSDWYVSGAPDERWDNDMLHLLDDLTGDNFEAVDTSGLMIDYDWGAAGQADYNANPPASPVKLIFIHHSTGQNWLADGNGELGLELQANNYFVSDTNYNWGPNEIGSRTDIPHWTEWFDSADTPTYMDALFNESNQHSSYTRLPTDPGGENEIVMFKSCFPNSDLSGNPNDPPSASGWLTVGHAKYVYNQILQYFATQPDKLFVVITAPPLRDGTHAANARAFNQWLMFDWLAQNNYTLHNVAVFDFYNVLTSADAHHRYNGGQVEHIITASNTLAYPTGDDHPSAAGGQKASAEFVPLLNIFYHRWKGDPVALPGVGFYEDRDSHWRFSSGWTSYTGAGPHGNNSRYTNVVGSQAQFSFNGTKFRFTYVKASNRGLIDVYVDGAKVNTIDAWAAATAWQQTWTSPILAPGDHAVRFVHAGGGTYIDVDAIEIIIPSDVTAPAAITDLAAAAGTTTGTVSLSWTAPGDDGSTGTATSYLVRYGTSAITDETAWNAATPVTTGVPTPAAAGATETMTVPGLAPTVTYYFAVRAQDEEPNLGGLSNSPSAAAQGLAPVPAGTYDDTDINLVYTGSWTTYSGAGPANNTSHYANTAGSEAQISFNGVKLKLTYVKARNRGSIDVYIDGTKVTQLNAYASSLTWQASWTSATLPAGIHTARFVHAGGGTYIDIDTVQVLDPPPTVGIGTYEDTDPAWVFSNGWTAYSGTGPSGNSDHYTTAAGSEAQISINGNRFTLTYVKAKTRGLIDVYVDGSRIAQIDAYAPTLTWRATWTSPSLTPGVHVVRFVHAGGTYIDIDAIQVLAPPPTVGAGTYDDSHAAWVFSTGWTTYSGAGPANNSTHYSNVPGSEAQLTFSGTGFVFKYVRASNRGAIDVYVDGTKVGTINATNSTLVWQASWSSPGVSAGTHTVRFVHAGGGTYIDVDAITILP